MDNLAKVHFHLEPDEDGWPPVASESVWAKPGEKEHEYIIENVPFFTTEATVDDTVQVRQEEGRLCYEKVVRESTNSLLRVIVVDRTQLKEVSKSLVALGCITELAPQWKLIAVNVPSSVSLSAVIEQLQTQASAGVLDYEEAILRQ
jgi:hypothetical protein